MALFMQDRQRETVRTAIATTPHCFVGRKWPDLVAGRTTASPFFSLFFSFGLGYAILIKPRLLPACLLLLHCQCSLQKTKSHAWLVACVHLLLVVVVFQFFPFVSVLARGQKWASTYSVILTRMPYQWLTKDKFYIKKNYCFRNISREGYQSRQRINLARLVCDLELTRLTREPQQKNNIHKYTTIYVINC